MRAGTTPSCGRPEENRSTRSRSGISRVRSRRSWGKLPLRLSFCHSESPQIRKSSCRRPYAAADDPVNRRIDPPALTPRHGETHTEKERCSMPTPPGSRSRSVLSFAPRSLTRWFCSRLPNRGVVNSAARQATATFRQRRAFSSASFAAARIRWIVTAAQSTVLGDRHHCFRPLRRRSTSGARSRSAAPLRRKRDSPLCAPTMAGGHRYPPARSSGHINQSRARATLWRSWSPATWRPSIACRR